MNPFINIINIFKEAAQDTLDNMSAQDYMLHPELERWFVMNGVYKDIRWKYYMDFLFPVI